MSLFYRKLPALILLCVIKITLLIQSKNVNINCIHLLNIYQRRIYESSGTLVGNSLFADDMAICSERRELVEENLQRWNMRWTEDE